MRFRKATDEYYDLAFVFGNAPEEESESRWREFLSMYGNGFHIDREKVKRAILNIHKKGLDAFEDDEAEEISAEISGRWLFDEEGKRSDTRVPRILLANRGNVWQMLKVSADIRQVRNCYVCHTICRKTCSQHFTYLREADLEEA